jgi:hypothetical protein
MPGDANAHLVVERLRGGDVDPGRRMRGDKLLGVAAFARPCAAENEGQARKFGNGGNLSSGKEPCHTTCGPATQTTSGFYQQSGFSHEQVRPSPRPPQRLPEPPRG